MQPVSLMRLILPLSVRWILTTVLLQFKQWRSGERGIRGKALPGCRIQEGEGARLLGLRVRILPGAWMSVTCECCMLSRTGLCDGTIIYPKESSRMWCVVVCDPETWRIRRPWTALGCSARGRKTLPTRHRYNMNFNIMFYNSMVLARPSGTRIKLVVLNGWWMKILIKI